MDVSLRGKVALVTGAGPNIGGGIALALERYGARVACNDLVLVAAKAAVRRRLRRGDQADRDGAVPAGADARLPDHVLEDITWHNCFRFPGVYAPKLFSSREQRGIR